MKQKKSQPNQFDLSQSLEIETIFNEFKDLYKDKLVVDDFLTVLKKQGVYDTSQLLTKKLVQLQGAELSFIEFSSLFDFSLKFQENLDNLFNIVDGDGNGKISIDDLRLLNQRYSILFYRIYKELGLTQQEIEIMINYPLEGKKDIPITQKVFNEIIFQ